MKKTVNLETIVYCVYESEIEEQPDERTRESKKKSCYESTREQLNQIFRVLDFDANLIKDLLIRDLTLFHMKMDRL